jgi:hypothetical protein
MLDDGHETDTFSIQLWGSPYPRPLLSGKSELFLLVAISRAPSLVVDRRLDRGLTSATIAESRPLKLFLTSPALSLLPAAFESPLSAILPSDISNAVHRVFLSR